MMIYHSSTTTNNLSWVVFFKPLTAVMSSNKPIGYMLPCPNCKQLTIPCSDEAGLLTDWCDSCDKSIFDNSDDVQLPSDTFDGGQVQEP